MGDLSSAARKTFINVMRGGNLPALESSRVFLWSRGRMPSFFSLDASVAPLMPRSSAAPPCPYVRNFAFLSARRTLAGVTPLEFDGRPTDEPVVIAWMPALSVFFRDPDGHLLEYLAMLPDGPRPEDGVVSWHTWRTAR